MSLAWLNAHSRHPATWHGARCGARWVTSDFSSTTQTSTETLTSSSTAIWQSLALQDSTKANLCQHMHPTLSQDNKAARVHLSSATRIFLRSAGFLKAQSSNFGRWGCELATRGDPSRQPTRTIRDCLRPCATCERAAAVGGCVGFMALWRCSVVMIEWGRWMVRLIAGKCHLLSRRGVDGVAERKVQWEPTERGTGA